MILRENRNLLLARFVDSARKEPADREAFDTILNRLRSVFAAPEARCEVMTSDKYTKSFPIINRIIAESIDFADGKAFFALMCK